MRPQNRVKPSVRPPRGGSGVSRPDSQEAWDAHLHRSGLGVPIEDVITIDYTDPAFLNPNSEYARMFKHEAVLVPNSATPVIITPEENTMPEENETTAAAGWSVPFEQSYDFIRPNEPRFVISFNASDALIGPFDSHKAASDYADVYEQTRRGLPHATFPTPTFHALESPDLMLMADKVPPIQVARGGPKWGDRPAAEDQSCQFEDSLVSEFTEETVRQECNRTAIVAMEFDGGEKTLRSCRRHVGYMLGSGYEEVTLTSLES